MIIYNIKENIKRYKKIEIKHIINNRGITMKLIEIQFK